MNKAHLEYCGGPEWAETVKSRVIPWTTTGIDLGDHLLEVGPGPGLTTNLLMTMVPRLTAAELDDALAAALSTRLAATNVEVWCGDGTETPFADGEFSGAICLTMLHHLPTPALQDKLFAELNRVVRDGGPVIGSDSIASEQLRAFHEDDIYVPIDPRTLEARLSAAGLTGIEVETNEYAFRFLARATGK